VVKAGQLDLTGDRDLVCEVDLLGQVHQELRNPNAKKAHGEVHTPTVIADGIARAMLAGMPMGPYRPDGSAANGTAASPGVLL
jgi:hypothetical protein